MNKFRKAVRFSLFPQVLCQVGCFGNNITILVCHKKTLFSATTSLPNYFLIVTHRSVPDIIYEATPLRTSTNECLNLVITQEMSVLYLMTVLVVYLGVSMVTERAEASTWHPHCEPRWCLSVYLSGESFPFIHSLVSQCTQVLCQPRVTIQVNHIFIWSC